MATTHRSARLRCVLLSTVFCLSACAQELEPTPIRPHGQVGAEIFRVVCMNLAAQAFPNDLTGERFSARCDGAAALQADDPAPEGARAERAYVRHQALLERRERLVAALTAAFDSETYRTDELRSFFGAMIPLYDPPEQLPQLTRAAVQLLQQLIDAKDSVGSEAISALERMSPRSGYRPARSDLALTRAVLGYPGIDPLLRSTLAAIDPQTGPARGPFEELLRAAAFDLSSAERVPDPKQRGTLAVARDLLFAEDDAFAGEGAPLYLTLRDGRGLALPAAEGTPISLPFVDADGDQLADVDARGRFVLASGGAVPPYPRLALPLAPSGSVPHDASGRALDASGEPLYRSIDANRTMLAGLLRDAGPLLAESGGKRPALLDYLYGLNGLLGEPQARTHKAGKAVLGFEGPDTATGPLFDFVHALTSTLPFPESGALFEVLEQLIRDHEPALAGLIEAGLYIKERSAAYPDAVFEKPHDFWDDLLGWFVQVAERPGLLEGMMRGLMAEETAKAGPLMGDFMRFRDRANYPLGAREELEALGIDMRTVPGKLDGDCAGPGCGQPCDLTTRCPSGLACVVKSARNPAGVCGSVREAVAAHRSNVNFPCPNPPVALLGASDPAATCKPKAPYPSLHHRGMRGCPDQMPADGASCGAAGGVGLCSWDGGSCSCDCEGGLCRHGAAPVWTCTDKPTPGFADWVDRSQPDNRLGQDGHSNQSLFQRTIALIHDLHVPGKLCNKQGATLKMYDPAGTNNEALFGGAGVVFGDMVGPYDSCKLLHEPEIVQFFARTILGTARLELLNEDLDSTLTTLLPVMGMTKNQLMERQTQIRGLFIEAPTPEAIARMVFSPFLPFQEWLLDLSTSRDDKVIVDLHRDTIMAWELKDPISGASYYDALAPFLRSMDPKGEGDSDLDLYGDIISIAHRHWSSRKSDATTRACEEGTRPLDCEPAAPLFAYQSNLASYEELVAEALVDAQLMARVGDLMRALAAIELPGGRDGISVLSEVFKNLLLPRRSCLSGNCQDHPLRARDGKTSTASNTGKPIDELAPIYLLLDSLNAIDDRLAGAQAGRLGPWRDARSKLVDVFFDVDRSGPSEWHFNNPRGRAILLASLRFLRERWSLYEAEQAECKARGGSTEACRALRDWSFGLEPRLEATLGQPVVAALLRLNDGLRDLEGDPAGQLAALGQFLADGQAANKDSFQATLLGTADLLQVLEDTANMAPLMGFVARAVAGNASEVASGADAPLDVANGTVQKALTLARSLQELSPEQNGQESTLAELLHHLAKPHGSGGEAPLDIILESIVAVNRTQPGASDDAPLEAADLRSLLDEAQQFLGSKRHGLERLYDIVQSRKLP